VNLRRLFRINQWGKNTLVFLLPLSDGQIVGTNSDIGIITKSIFAFFALSLTSSGNYIINDIHDIREDQTHPFKRDRPIASGKISIGLGYLIGISGIFLGILLGFTLIGKNTGLAVLVFALIQFLYTRMLRSLQGLDLITISTLFVTRAAIPYTYAEVKISPWFLMIILFFSLSIISAKRLAELKNHVSRAVLKNYTETQLLILVAGFWVMSIASYASWIQNQVSVINVTWAFISIFPLITVFIRLLPQLLSKLAEQPEKHLFKDKLNMALACFWLVSYLLARGYL
jgi:decaprenyl-phosphate phosphoribosyltransferase